MAQEASVYPPTMPARAHIHISTLALLALTLAGCMDLSSPETPTRNYGLLRLRAEMDTTPPVLHAHALFYNGVAPLLPADPRVLDQCAVLDYTPGQEETEPALGPDEIVNAGDSVTLQVGSTRYALPNPGIGPHPRWEPVGGDSVPYTPGDSVRLTTPGVVGGFPASSIALRMPQPFAFDSIPTTPSPTGLTLAWSPPTGGGPTVMRVAMRYATTGSTSLNKQIYCVLADDGEQVVDPGLSYGWSHADPTLREFQATRARILGVAAGTTDSLYVNATISTPPIR